MNADDVIRTLKLQPHPKEDGYFVESYRSAEKISWEGLPPRYDGFRVHSTAIYFLLKAGAFSEMHRLRSDEIFHFYMGAPAEMLLLDEINGAGKILKLGTNLETREMPQIVVPKNCWQGLRSSGEFSLLGTTVAPGFEYTDYESGDCEYLVRKFPLFEKQIRALTR
jgi:uncharacterized protein